MDYSEGDVHMGRRTLTASGGGRGRSPCVVGRVCFGAFG